MIILSIDPGVATGYAVINAWDTVVETGTLVVEDVGETLRRTINHYRQMGHKVRVAVEKFPLAPAGELADQLREVTTTISNVLSMHSIIPIEVLPGVWKTSSIPQSPTHFKGELLTEHQKDAIRMGRYVLRSRGYAQSR